MNDDYWDRVLGVDSGTWRKYERSQRSEEARGL